MRQDKSLDSVLTIRRGVSPVSVLAIVRCVADVVLKPFFILVAFRG